jgi:hypothetical protein
MDIKEFIKDKKELKDINVDNIIEFIDYCKFVENKDFNVKEVVKFIDDKKNKNKNKK